MAANKRIRRPVARTAKSLVSETTPAPRRPHELKEAVHRLEVEIAAAGRIVSERRGRGPDFMATPVTGRGYAVSQRLTHAQSRKRRARWAMQVAMFFTSTCLLAGAAAWLYRFWQSVR